MLDQSMILSLFARGAERAPLWLAMHGTNQHAETFLSWMGLDSLANPAYNGLIPFNVGARSEPISTGAALVRGILGFSLAVAMH